MAPSIKVANFPITKNATQEMSDIQQRKTDLQDEIKACVTAFKGGATLKNIEDDYKTFSGEDIPFREFGYNSLSSLMRDIPELYSQNDRWFAKMNEKTRHLQEMIQGQKDAKKHKRKKDPPFRLKSRTLHRRERKENRDLQYDCNRNFLKSKNDYNNFKSDRPRNKLSENVPPSAKRYPSRENFDKKGKTLPHRDFNRPKFGSTLSQNTYSKNFNSKNQSTGVSKKSTSENFKENSIQNSTHRDSKRNFRGDDVKPNNSNSSANLSQQDYSKNLKTIDSFKDKCLNQNLDKKEFDRPKNDAGTKNKYPTFADFKNSENDISVNTSHPNFSLNSRVKNEDSTSEDLKNSDNNANTGNLNFSLNSSLNNILCSTLNESLNQSLNVSRDPRLNRSGSPYVLREKIPDERPHYPTIKVDPTFEDLAVHVTCPVIAGKQLVGDDFFLQLCMKYLDCLFVRQYDYSPVTLGTVQSGSTLKMAITRIKRLSSMSNKIALCLGASEIKQKMKADEIIEQLKNLLDVLHGKFEYSQGAITLCTIPPLVELEKSKAEDQLEEQHKVNRWIRKVATCNDYKLIDFYKEFTSDGGTRADQKLFHPEGSIVSGSRHRYVLWSRGGRQKAMRLLSSQNVTINKIIYNYRRI